jgi:hypothetical protein
LQTGTFQFGNTENGLEMRIEDIEETVTETPAGCDMLVKAETAVSKAYLQEEKRDNQR